MKAYLFQGMLGLVYSMSVVAAPTNLSTYEIDLAQHAKKVEFLAVGNPSQIKIAGKIEEGKPQATGKLVILGTRVTGIANVNIDAFTTGIDLRNEHMKKKYLHTDKYPSSEFEFTDLTLPSDISAKEFEGKDLPVEGKLRLHGVEKLVKGIAQVKKSDNSFEMQLEIKFPLLDFGIQTPSYLGIKVSETVTVTVLVVSPVKQNA